jgi:nucleoside-diphosphate-sugar epimerase
MLCVVTGAAGFIGSHLCEELLRLGHTVRAVDAFVPYYSSEVKERNRAAAAKIPTYRFENLDLRTDPLEDLVEGADFIFHIAAMPGLAKSWTDFDGYWSCNVLATQRLIEAVRRSGPNLKRLIYASTSSVYGKFAGGDESLPTRPISPYGVTKLAGEHLCRAYAESFHLPLVILRYFSVYGPRQRPDMGYYKFIRALLTGGTIDVTGDGHQIRGNTYVGDCVAATVSAMEALPGETFNVGGGEMASVWNILKRLEAIIGVKATTRQLPARPGDQQHNSADTTKLRRHLGWRPRIELDEGLALQVEWQRDEFHAEAKR